MLSNNSNNTSSFRRHNASFGKGRLADCKIKVKYIYSYHQYILVDHDIDLRQPEVYNEYGFGDTREDAMKMATNRYPNCTFIILE